MLTKAVSGSNAADKSSDNGAPSGGVAKEGFTLEPYPSQKPAGSQGEVANTKENIGALGNEGTGMNSYHDQKKTISALSGK